MFAINFELNLSTAFTLREGRKIRAGLVGNIKYTSAFIDTLWVDKSLRKQGLGRELLQRAEEYAIRYFRKAL